MLSEVTPFHTRTCGYHILCKRLWWGFLFEVHYIFWVLIIFSDGNSRGMVKTWFSLNKINAQVLHLAKVRSLPSTSAFIRIHIHLESTTGWVPNSEWSLDIHWRKMKKWFILKIYKMIGYFYIINHLFSTSAFIWMSFISLSFTNVTSSNHMQALWCPPAV